MPQYVNRFQCIANLSRSEINLNLFHEYPCPPLDGPRSETMQTECDPVAQIVLTRETARELIRILDDSLNDFS